ncbi:hypothetical protein SAY87_007447 [Trapa incisa]|uniref:Transcription initiation factor TFIID subunit 8 n=1 Tax=Trapa incisa TaxID=236973 RepID=A0AAN7KMB2_9MYRT|nr:hypothetical protein SAY87_007447 [Trapa incisa]
MGASEVGDCIASSGMLRETIEYVDISEEIPFAYPLPWFPVYRERRLIPSFSQMDETPPADHIPYWLPALPDPHTYKQTPTWNERKSKQQTDKLEQVRQRRKVERSLLNLQQRLAICGPAGAATSSFATNESVRGIQSVQGNPFVDPPLQAGEKDVPAFNMSDMVKGPGKDNDISVFKMFGPAVEAVRDQFSDDADKDVNDESMALPFKGHAIHFKFKTSKKVLGHSMDLGLLNRHMEKPVSGRVPGDERDEKKRRAEYILRQSMENPQELTQM